MSEAQIYRRLNAAQKLLDGQVKRGNKNAIFLTEGGFKILENIIELEKQGRTLANAVREVEFSLQDTSQAELAAEGLEEHPDKHEELRKTGIRSLIEQVGYLKGQLDLKDELLKRCQEEVERLRQENEELKRKVAIVEYKEQKRWWEFWK
jgi:predicted RNase H-like nuclease (RuvC/YqgF family)